MSCPRIGIICPENCPAQCLKNLPDYGNQGAFPRGTNWSNWIDYCENLRRNECNQILKKHGRIKLYILTESIPYGRFIYDPNSNYRVGKGLRKQLCEELIGVICPPNITHCSQCPYLPNLLNLRNKGILIVDCALCPLHKMGKQYKERRLAATICLNNNTAAYLNVTPDAPIITIFPNHCGFYRKKKPNVQKRVVEEFNFGYLRCLKDTIEQILGDP